MGRGTVIALAIATLGIWLLVRKAAASRRLALTFSLPICLQKVSTGVASGVPF